MKLFTTLSCLSYIPSILVLNMNGNFIGVILVTLTTISALLFHIVRPKNSDVRVWWDNTWKASHKLFISFDYLFAMTTSVYAIYYLLTNYNIVKLTLVLILLPLTIYLFLTKKNYHLFHGLWHILTGLLLYIIIY